MGSLNTMAPNAPPTLRLPEGSQTCRVSIINTTCDLTCPPEYLVDPKIPGHEWLNLPTYSYHIKHDASGRELLFDLGCRKDWPNSVPEISAMLRARMPGFRVAKSVPSILAEGGVNVNNVEALVLSHWHFDHCGAPSELPKSVKMIVGPKFRETFLPGYPAKPDSPFHEADFEGREVVEVPFSDDVKIGQFQAHDYFGDGSFYVLNVPGHAVGHISALVRTTADTFVFLGGDVCHFTGVLRPTQFIPMPDQIPDETPLDKRIPRPCPCSAFLSSHPDQNNCRTTPFYKVGSGPGTFYVNPPQAQESVHALMSFDASPNILITIAHDPTSLDVFPFFPNGTLNDWKEKGWKQAVHWGFVNELPYFGKTVREQLVDGLYIDGEMVRDLRLPGA